MDHTSDRPRRPSAADAAGPDCAPGLALVGGALRLAECANRAPGAWRAALGALLDWLAIEPRFVPAPHRRRLTGWPGAGHGKESGAPVFAPWTAWCPTAFQNGGLPGLPKADFVASYALAPTGPGPDSPCAVTDILLLSPHPMRLTAEQGHGDCLPQAGIMRAMIRTACTEGRTRIAILVHARHRAAIGRLRLGEDLRLCPAGTTLEIRTLEEALPMLMAGAARWDAIIAMPDLRGMVFAVLAETAGVQGGWPMLWWTRKGVVRITAEALDDSAGSAPLDARLAVQALALALREAGLDDAARRLHGAWAQAPGCGTASTDAGSIARLTGEPAPGQRLEPRWRALENKQMSVFGNRSPTLRIVPSNLASS